MRLQRYGKILTCANLFAKLRENTAKDFCREATGYERTEIGKHRLLRLQMQRNDLIITPLGYGALWVLR